MSSKKTQKQVVQQDVALDAYLESLLEQIPDEIPSPPQPQPVVKKTVTKTVPTQQPSLKKSAEKITSVVPEKDAKPAVDKKEKDSLVRPLSVMPEWTQQEFQALTFRVEDMILAVPLTALLRTINFDRKVTSVPRQPSWFIGLLDEHDSRIGVLDAGQLIFGKTRGRQRDQEEQPFSQILITEDGRWGLACDEVMEIQKLDPQQVRWRTLRETRPWLVGTVIDELTAVIDVRSLIPCEK